MQWSKQSDLVKKLCLRESLLQGLILMLQYIQSPKIKIRSIKVSLTLLRSLGLKSILFNKSPSKDFILPPDALMDLLMLILREALKLSKDKEMEQYLQEENLSQ